MIIKRLTDLNSAENNFTSYQTLIVWLSVSAIPEDIIVF